MRKSVLGSVVLTQICYSVLKGASIYILQIAPFLTTHGAHLGLKCHQTCRPEENTNRLPPVDGFWCDSVPRSSIDFPGASFNHNRTISNRLLKHLILIGCDSNEKHETKTLWLSLIFHGVQAYSSQIPSLPHLEILSRTRSSAALMAVQRSLPSQSQLGGFRSAMVNQLHGLVSLGFQPCKW